VNAMRLTLPTYNPAKECRGCTLRDENKVSAHILSYQIADQLLRKYSGTWKLSKTEIKLNLKGVAVPLVFELNTGTLRYGSIMTQVVSRYSPEKGLARLSEEICQDFALPAPESSGQVDPLFNLFLKLIEIFHARCGLVIRPIETEQGVKGWELCLCDDGPSGWIGVDGVAENRFGKG